jgi:hypothetical protein
MERLTIKKKAARRLSPKLYDGCLEFCWRLAQRASGGIPMVGSPFMKVLLLASALLLLIAAALRYFARRKANALGRGEFDGLPNIRPSGARMDGKPLNFGDRRCH